MKKLYQKTLILIFALLLPTSTASQISDIQKVESEMLEKASQNIEKYRKGTAEIVFKNQSGKPVQNVNIEVNQITHDFLFGSIIFDLVNIWEDETTRPELYKRRFKELFNFAIFPFYWASYERTPGMAQWEKMLPVIEWCKTNDTTTKGHPLVWTHSAGVPKWLSNFPVPLTEELLKARVINIVSGFKEKIDIWDVVNEPVNTRTWNHTDAEVNEMGHFREPLEKAADFTEKALQWAYSGNPQANLIVNEFGQITDNTIRKRFIELIQKLKSRNTPISGLGIQAHYWMTDWYNPKILWEAFDIIAKLGYPLHLTEFIPQSGGKEITGGWREGTWTLETQAEFAEQFYRLSFGHPSIVSINWWGLSDKNIWQTGGGLIDENYKPKPVYNRLKKLIHEEWKTKLSTTTNNEGTLNFRGFFGKYNITLINNNDTIKTFKIHLRENEENKWVFTIN